MPKINDSDPKFISTMLDHMFSSLKFNQLDELKLGTDIAVPMSHSTQSEPVDLYYKRDKFKLPTTIIQDSGKGKELLALPVFAPVKNTLSSATQTLGVKPEWIAAMILNESSGIMNPNLNGDVGQSRGVTQIKNVAWNDQRYQNSFKEQYKRKPNRATLEDQVRMGAIILNQLHDEWGGNVEHMFRAYNSGSASLREQLAGKRPDAAASTTAYWNKIKENLGL